MHIEVPARPFWIFDLDGTLTIPLHDFAAKGLELGIPEGTPMLEAAHLAPPKERDRLLAAIEAWEWSIAEAASPAPGALELLSDLKRRQVQLGILTRNTRAIALRTLEVIGLMPFFDSLNVLGRDEARPKPDPEGIQRLISRWGTEPSQVVMVGDYLFDLQAGRAAGVLTLWSRPGESTEDFSDWADYVVCSLDDLTLIQD